MLCALCIVGQDAHPLLHSPLTVPEQSFVSADCCVVVMLLVSHVQLADAQSRLLESVRANEQLGHKLLAAEQDARDLRKQLDEHKTVAVLELRKAEARHWEVSACLRALLLCALRCADPPTTTTPCATLVAVPSRRDRAGECMHARTHAGGVHVRCGDGRAAGSEREAGDRAVPHAAAVSVVPASGAGGSAPRPRPRPPPPPPLPRWRVVHNSVKFTHSRTHARTHARTQKRRKSTRRRSGAGSGGASVEVKSIATVTRFSRNMKSRILQQPAGRKPSTVVSHCSLLSSYF
jgi:hypothetical protein